jgi:hypothetical protein
MTMIIDGTNGITFPDTSRQYNSYYNFKNRIINGAMVIDQRNAGASVTASAVAANTYTIDRFAYVVTQASKFTVQQNAGSVTPPVGFGNYLGITSSSAYSVLTGDTFLINQSIEGFNTSDLAFGTASAATVTLSFWVRSSLTGTFGGALVNSANSRSYPFSYTISSANTWEQKSVTIAGDTSGTWVGATNGVGLRVRFGLGSGSTFTGTSGAWAAGDLVQPTGSVSVVGTNGATFYITGVQLEKGIVSTPFDFRPYGTELALCQRYYYKNFPAASSRLLAISGSCDSTTTGYCASNFPVVMRTRPTALEQSGTAADYTIFHSGSSTVCSAVPTFNVVTTDAMQGTSFTVASGLTIGRAGNLGTASSSAYLAWSAEL